MATDLTTIISAVVDDAMTLGVFERVNGHEADSSPGTGVTADVWVMDLVPLAAASGLAEVTALLPLKVRLYAPLSSVNRDVIDPQLLRALQLLFGQYAGGFTLGGLIQNVDVFGHYGIRMSAPFGYVEVNAVEYRCTTVTVPCIVDDLWTEAP